MSQEEVEAKISGLLELHAKWTALDGGSGSSGLRSELQASLKALELDLEDLEDALSIAKGDRTQEKESVEQREAYIATARSQLASVAASVAGQSVTPTQSRSQPVGRPHPRPRRQRPRRRRPRRRLRPSRRTTRCPGAKCLIAQ